ncbi:hypothetical protein BM1_00884 [Bipolaris maydis]|nr:hypothetical protein BM1_00884 [Bipolaris maydis]
MSSLMSTQTEDARLRLKSTAFVIYYHADLAKARQFLLDFGLSIAKETPGEEIFFQGYGEEPFVYVARQASGTAYFEGAAYEVESRDELERARNLKGASPIISLDSPGGGEYVKLTDPVGHHVYLVHGQTKKVPEMPALKKLVVNYEDEKPRKGRFHRFEPGPAPVYRWGHYGVTYPEGSYQEMYDWYTKTLTLAPSDIVYKNEEPITCFFHIDRGLEFTDHHAFFFKRAKPDAKPSVAHAAFEIHDFDVQQLGHNYLESKGYEICWGVGRHVLGSQVFDYWFDPSGFIVEHYADGDLVNVESQVSHVQAGPHALKIWGPPVPGVF